MSTPGIGAFGSLKRLFRKAVSVPDRLDLLLGAVVARNRPPVGDFACVDRFEGFRRDHVDARLGDRLDHHDRLGVDADDVIGVLREFLFAEVGELRFHGGARIADVEPPFPEVFEARPRVAEFHPHRDRRGLAPGRLEPVQSAPVVREALVRADPVPIGMPARFARPPVRGSRVDDRVHRRGTARAEGRDVDIAPAGLAVGVARRRRASTDAPREPRTEPGPGR